VNLLRFRKTELIIFLVLLFSYAYFFPRWADWNMNSRFDLVLAIVDKGTLAIDDYYQNTGDYASYKGHFYSDKAPGVSFLGVPAYITYKVISAVPPVPQVLARAGEGGALADTLREGGTGLLPDKVSFAMALTFVTFLTVAIPSAILGVLLYRTLGLLCPDRWNLAVTLAYGLGTAAFPYANALYGHQVAASLLFGAFYLLLRGKTQGFGVARLACTGLLLGYAVITEYPTALIAVAIVVYALLVVPQRTRLGWLVLGGVLPLIPMALYNYAIFGTPVPVGYKYSVLYTVEHSAGIISLTYPKLDALLGITLSPFRGLFFLSPVLLLAVPGFLQFWRKLAWRPEWGVALFSVVSFLLFNASSSMWWGGFTVGPRYVVPMLPFMSLGLAFFLAGGSMWRRAIFGALAMLSVAMVWAQTIAGQSFPEAMFKNPLLEVSLPYLARGDIARNLGMVLLLRQWYSLLPLVAILLLLALALWVRGPGEKVSSRARSRVGVWEHN